MKNIKNTFLVVLLMAFGTTVAFGQGYWDPQTNITGYVSTEFNYFENLNGYENNYGTDVSEAGFLITYMPKENLTLKGVFVYRPGFQFDQMLNEAYGELTVNPALKVRAGRFLLPLSPMNTYYYSPVNTSATLPIVVSNHEFFPLNGDGFSVNGSYGDDFKVNYDVFAMGFRNTLWLKTGPVGFFGNEVGYFSAQEQSPIVIDESFNNTYNVGAGGTVGLAYKNYVTAGFSLFKQKDSTIPIGVTLPAGALFAGSPETYIVNDLDQEKLTYGTNLKLQYGNTTVAGEFWNGDLLVGGDDVTLKGSFVVISHKINKFTPYARFEQQETASVDYDRITAGLNFKPVYEATIKMEYLHYIQDSGNVDGFVASLIYSF